MYNAPLRPADIADSAPLEAHLSFCTTRTEAGNEILIFVRKHGDDYVILIQLMPHCSL